MSRIYFNSPGEDPVEVPGREFGYAERLLSNLVLAAYDLDTNPIHMVGQPTSNLKLVINTPEYLHHMDGYGFNAAILPHIYIGDYTVKINNKIYRGDEIALNTALDLGNDQLIFLSRLVGQAAVNGYVEGPNRSWLANILDFGMTVSGVLHSEVGWEEVVKLLRKRGDRPVVMSHSTHSYYFPQAHWAIMHGLYELPKFFRDQPEFDIHVGEEDSEAWYKMDEASQWDIALAGLRTHNETHFLEMKPWKWDRKTFGYSNGVGAFAIKKYYEELAKFKAEERRK